MNIMPYIVGLQNSTRICVLIGTLAFYGVSPCVLGQDYAIVTDGAVEILEKSNSRGTLYYDIYVEGGRKIGTDEYEFRDINDARLRIDMRIAGKNDRWNDRIRIGIGPEAFRHHNLSIWQPYGLTTFMIGPDNGKKSVRFKPNREGSSTLYLRFSFLDANDDGWSDPANWDIENALNAIKVPNLTIRKAPKPKPTPESVAGNLDSMFMFFANGSNVATDRHKVRDMIEEMVASDYKRMVLHDESIPTTEAFVKKYTPYLGKGVELVDKNVNLAKNNIEDIRREDSLSRLDSKDKPVIRITEEDRKLREFEQLLKARDSVGLNSFLSLNAHFIPVVDVDAARDSIVCWTEAAFLPRGRKDGREIIELQGFVAPAYYDVHREWIDIDDELLKREGVLSIAIRRPEQIKLTIADKVCPNKRLEIPLDNLMRVVLSVDSLNGLYHFKFEGGTKPYKLKLFADSTDGNYWTRGGILENELTLVRDSLQAEGLAGNFHVEAYSTGSDAPVMVGGGLLFIPELPTPAWVLPALIVLAVGGLAVLLLFMTKRARRGRADIFSQT